MLSFFLSIRILGRKFVKPEEYPDRYLHEIPNSERWMWRPCHWKATVGETIAGDVVEKREAEMLMEYRSELAQGKGMTRRGGRRTVSQSEGRSTRGVSGAAEASRMKKRGADSKQLLSRTQSIRKEEKTVAAAGPLGRLYCRVVPGVRVELVASFGSIGDTPGFFRSPMGVACYRYVRQAVMCGELNLDGLVSASASIDSFG
jgi:hypothetical protein